MTGRLPLVVILGATGSGKTKLSLELATRFGGEIIGADSMQIYKGLDIITAKASLEERALAPHHMIDDLHPHQMYTVVEYRNRALPVIDDIFRRDKLPIVVGGTNYYIESLLWKILIADPDNSELPESGLTLSEEHALESAELHKKLMLFDPVRAKQLHPNDKRKILRSLEVYQQTGRRHSDILQEQQFSKGGSSFGGPLRFANNALVFWLQCDQLILDERLNSRVDFMLEQGLIDELLGFHKQYNIHRFSTTDVPDYTRGIFQSIGFKEFHTYLMLDHLERESDAGKILLKESIEELKRATRRYARKQKKWIRNRLLSKSDRKIPPVYGLDATDVFRWSEFVLQPAIEIVEGYIERVQFPYAPLPLEEPKSLPNSKADTFFCDVCNRVFVGEFQWKAHTVSNRHKRVLHSKRRSKICKDAKCE